ncbi:MAG: phosphoribosylamine--glycine ligase [Deltaproteobacteria bacterium]|nr:phosphoribosylamine--glycine ligase [Deltaproteobacteria bacterium]MBW2361604.1 phosphoribosylamine--glycine ligase [Deltaproteobacteria bacterium]
MRILVVGSGGREHALLWKIAQSPLASALHAAPGSAAIGELATCHPDVKANDLVALQALAEREAIDLVVVGPEDPLAAGLTDRLRAAGIAVFGPTAAAAQLEASKTFAKQFMARHGIPSAAFAVFDSLDAARAHVRELGGPCVVKADGLAAGKGVAVCDGPEDAEAALDEMMRERRFGDAGATVVIEERMQGEEASYYAISDGERVVTLTAAQDHKRALDGDCGENTGGMGAYAPAPVVNDAVEKRILEEVVHPAIRGMASDGVPYTGVLYVGLMIDASGAPRVVEFNVRFGDPETQPLLVGMQGDLVPLLDGAARGRLDNEAAVGFRDAAVCVVLASGGYPRSYPSGKPITGLEAAAAQEGVVVFHAGTRRAADGGFETAGGRVLGVTARGVSVAEARERAYAACDVIAFEGAHRRNDIASRALDR